MIHQTRCAFLKITYTATRSLEYRALFKAASVVEQESTVSAISALEAISGIN